MLVFIGIKKAACISVVWWVNMNTSYLLTKLRQQRIERLIVLAVNQPAIERSVQVVKEGKNIEFKVFEVFCVQRQILVLRVQRVAHQIFFQNQVQLELLIQHAEFLPLGDLVFHAFVFEKFFEQGFSLPLPSPAGRGVRARDFIQRNDVIAVQDKLGFVPYVHEFIFKLGNKINDLVGDLLDGLQLL